MIDRDIVIDIRKVISTTGPFQTPLLSNQKNIYGKVKDAGQQEKEKGQLSGKVNVSRVDINEEEFDNETIAFINGLEKEIYKTVRIRNKVYLYLSDKNTEIN